MSDYRERACTCHPDEAPRPCPQRYAYSECVLAAEIERLRGIAQTACNETFEKQAKIDELLAALKVARNVIGVIRGPAYAQDDINAAIAKAEGK